jgi:hypothetical protein
VELSNEDWKVGTTERSCRRATRATDAPAANVSSTIRRFSSTDLFCHLFTWLATSTVICSDVSTYPSWTLSDVPTTGSILNYSHFVYAVQT